MPGLTEWDWKPGMENPVRAPLGVGPGSREVPGSHVPSPHPQNSKGYELRRCGTNLGGDCCGLLSQSPAPRRCVCLSPTDPNPGKSFSLFRHFQLSFRFTIMETTGGGGGVVLVWPFGFGGFGFIVVVLSGWLAGWGFLRSSPSSSPPVPRKASSCLTEQEVLRLVWTLWFETGVPQKSHARMLAPKP